MILSLWRINNGLHKILNEYSQENERLLRERSLLYNEINELKTEKEKIYNELNETKSKVYILKEKLQESTSKIKENIGKLVPYTNTEEWVSIKKNLDDLNKEKTDFNND
mgnify:CR=1 FL=1